MSRIEQMRLLPEVYGGDAIIEDQYRYLLRRWWGPDEKVLLWILLNPSTADADTNDATLRRCMTFSRREGYSRLEIVNLFAYRTPFPSRLKHVADPIGPSNDLHIQQALERAEKVVAGWGAFDSLQGRDLAVLQICTKPLYCLGTTQQGCPRHPSRLANATPLVVYQPPNTKGHTPLRVLSSVHKQPLLDGQSGS